MKNSRFTYRILLIICFAIVMVSCTKEEEPVRITELDVVDYDPGYLTIKLETDPAYLDSIYYTNNTQGTSFKIEKTEFSGYNSQTNQITSISRTLANGKKNDQVQCCFYVNSTMTVGAIFEDLSLTLDSFYLDSVNTVSTGGNSAFCITGTY